MGALQVAILAPQIGCTWVSPGLPHPKPPTFLRNFQIKFSGKSSGSPKFRRCLWRIFLPCFGGRWPYWRSPWACGLKMWWRMSRCHATSVRRWCQPRCQSASTPGVMVFLFWGGGFFGRQFWLAFVVVALRKTSQVDRFVFLTVLEHGQVDCWIMWDV